MGNIGINITERTDQGVPALAGDNELLLGILTATERGPIDRPILITGEAQFKRLFGTYISAGYGAYAFAGYRLNGGRLAYVVRVTGTGGAVASVTLVDRNAGTPQNTLKVEAGYKGDTDKGLWGNSLKVTVTDNANDATKFDLEVELSGVSVEIWRALTPSTAETAINDSVNGSEFIKVTNQGATTTAPLNNPALQADTALSAGTEPATAAVSDFQGNAGTHTGVYAFDGFDISHLICPDRHDTSLLTSLEAYCSARGTITAILSLPAGTTVSGAASTAASLQTAISYAALYLGHITVVDPIGTISNPVRVVAPDGQIAGIYARTWRTRGVHKAPAGVIDGSIRGSLAVDVDVLTDEDTTTLAAAGVNAIRSIRGYGRVVMVSRTLSKDTRWRYVNVRNLFNYIKRTLKDGLLWVQQEPNDAKLRRRVAKDITLPFMLSLFNQGAFGSGRPADVFTILCDDTNNTEGEIDLGNFHLDLTLYPSKPAESIYISVGQQQSGQSSVSEA